LLILGEGFELLCVLVPPPLVGRALGESAITARTGLEVIAILQNGRMVTHPADSIRLAADNELVMLGSTASRQTFTRIFSA